VVAWSGRIGVGALIIIAGLIAWPFVRRRMTCRSCGAPVGVLSIPRRRCGPCGSAVGSPERSRALSGDPRFYEQLGWKVVRAEGESREYQGARQQEA
jgi:hypothetical protein